MNPDLLRMDKQEAAMKKLIDTEDLCLADDICIPHRIRRGYGGNTVHSSYHTLP